jgi:hypothetical protein
VDLIDIFDEEPEIVTPKTPPVPPPVDGDIAYELREDLLDWLVNGKMEPPRAPGLHCSSLWTTCPRVPLLEKKYAKYLLVEEKDTAGQQLTYDVGHALHHMVQNTYLGPFGRLWGNWKCVRCQAVTFQGLLPTTCPKCELPARDPVDGSQNLIYAEMFVEDTDLKYCGHCDGICLSRAGNKFVFEFKTISKSQYGQLKAAKPEHVVQCHAYMHALKLSQAVVLYLDKGSQADWKKMPDGSWVSPNPHLKVFLIKWDQKLWDSMSRRIREFHEATDRAKVLPTVEIADINKYARICSHKGCDLALECRTREFCFAV